MKEKDDISHTKCFHAEEKCMATSEKKEKNEKTKKRRKKTLQVLIQAQNIACVHSAESQKTNNTQRERKK